MTAILTIRLQRLAFTIGRSPYMSSDAGTTEPVVTQQVRGEDTSANAHEVNGISATPCE